MSEYMCPFCVTPWKCNGPHIDEQDLSEFEGYISHCEDKARLMGYKEGYEEAKNFYTNECMSCGYAGEWSTYICDDCIKDMEPNDNM